MRISDWSSDVCSSDLPVLQHGQRLLRQSLAILEYLDEMWPQPPLLPAVARDRARVRALAQLIACDVHPLNNLRVMQYLERDWGVPQPEREVWSRHWIDRKSTRLNSSH